MKKTQSICTTILFISCVELAALGQKQPLITELKIGDQCPDFVFSHINLYPKNDAKLSDFKGKLVIIDFWAPWCGPCVSALPKLDSLQKKFQNEIVILPVTNQSASYVNNFFSRYTERGLWNLPYVTDDTILRKYFPYRLIPHEIWIDENGKVRAITSDQEVTSENIKTFLGNSLKTLKTKKDLLTRDGTKPLFAGGFGDNYQLSPNHIEYQSLFLTGYIDGAGTNTTPFIKVDGCIKRVFRNMIITNLYLHGVFIYNDDGTLQHTDPFLFYQLSRVILEVKDSSLFYYPGRPKTNWEQVPLERVCFTYEQYVPKADSLKANQYMLQDLNRYFGDLLGIEGLIERRKVKCWALVRTSKYKEILAKDTTGVGKKLKTSVGEFMNYLMYLRQFVPIPIIDITGIKQTREVFITTPDWDNIDINDLTKLNNKLSKYGLAFKLTYRKMNMVIIRDKDRK